jgi:S-adenosylmethionine hydrolase
MLMHIVADYGQGDLAFAEVAQRIKLHLPDAELVLTPVPPFSTLAAGFCIAQLGLNQAPPGMVIYHNIAPRMDDEAARTANAGERLSYVRLPNGVRVIGVNAGHALSFVRKEAEKLRWAAIPAEGSQFRSRDLFPQAAAAIALGRPQALADEIDHNEIPAVPDRAIAYVDGYGNVKTTVRFRTGMQTDRRITVRIQGVEHKAILSDGTFAVEQGHMAFAPGSSGWTSKHGEAIRWMEVFLRGGNAWEAFKRPLIGSSIEIHPR